MLKKYFFTSMLIFLFGLQNSYSYQQALIKDHNTVVYQDVKLVTPLFKLKKNTKVLVGEKKKNKGLVLPILIQNKVAYIKISDLEFKNKTKHTQSLEKDFSADKFEKKVSEIINSQSTLGFLQLSAGAVYFAVDPSWTAIAIDANPTNTTSYMREYNVGLSFNFVFNSNILLQAAQMTLISEIFTINMNAFGGGVSYDLFEINDSSFGIFGIYRIHRNTTLSSTTLSFAGKSSDLSYGAYINHMLGSAFSIKFSAYLNKLTVSNFDTSGTPLSFFDFNLTYSNMGIKTQLVIHL
jgi:hypothetical protein